MNVGVVIQARMGSTRLPGKVLRDIDGKPLLAHVMGRLEHLRHRVDKVVATTVQEQDQQIVKWCDQYGVKHYQGSELDVLDRYWSCTQLNGFDHVVRLTADNPFTDIEELDRLIDFHLQGGYDYSHSFGQMPIGVGAEIFSKNALKKSYEEGRNPNHREHVNEYIEETPSMFNIGRLVIPGSKISPSLRLTVDTEEDWRRACALASASHGRWLSTEEAIRLCLPSV